MIPARTLYGLADYVEKGRDPGDFLRAVLENDLMGAACRADPENLAALGEIGLWLYRNAPKNACGSPEKVRIWLDYAAMRV